MNPAPGAPRDAGRSTPTCAPVPVPGKASPDRADGSCWPSMEPSYVQVVVPGAASSPAAVGKDALAAPPFWPASSPWMALPAPRGSVEMSAVNQHISLLGSLLPPLWTYSPPDVVERRVDFRRGVRPKSGDSLVKSPSTLRQVPSTGTA